MHGVHKNDLPVLVYSTAIAGEETKVIIYFCIVTAVVTSLNSSSPLRTLSFTLSWDTKARSGTSFTVWYSTDGHNSDPTSPPQGAFTVSGLNSTSVTITLPDSDDSCKPYYVWIAGITPNGQQSPYSKRRRVEVCKAGGGESKKCISRIYHIGKHIPALARVRIVRTHHEYYSSTRVCSTFVPYCNWFLTGEPVTAAESAGATVAGSFLGGVVAGGAAALLVVVILCGSWKLKQSSGKNCKMNSEEET